MNRDESEAADWTADESQLAGQLHDLDCSDRTCEPHTFADKFPKARRLLTSDWLRAHDARVRAEMAADALTNPDLRLIVGTIADERDEARAERDRLAAQVRALHKIDSRPTSDHYYCEPSECDQAGDGELQAWCLECRRWAPCDTLQTLEDVVGPATEATT